jgi:hypothetical protein
MPALATRKLDENRKAIRRDVAATSLARVPCGQGVFVVLQALQFLCFKQTRSKRSTEREVRV